MLDVFINLDNLISNFIFTLPHPFLIKSFFELMSVLGNYGLVWIIISIYIIVVEEKKDHQFIKVFIISVLLTFITTNYLFKNIFKRSRPLSNSITVQIYKNYPKDYSFPSGHASTAFAAAYVLSKFDKKRKGFFYTMAILVSFSRIYLGFHYFFDVVTGSLLGLFISYFIIKFIYEKT